MKLRIKGDTLRLRVAPTEMARLLETGRVQDTIHFGPGEDAHLTYVLEHADVGAMAVRYAPRQVTVIVPTDNAKTWARGEDVGVYGSIAVAAGQLEIAVEKDWACLDQGDTANEDTFPNPKKC